MMYGNQVTALLLGRKKIDVFWTSTSRWLKLFPLTVLYYDFFDTANLFAVLKTFIYICCHDFCVPDL